MNIIKKIEACLVADWKIAYKWMSVQIAAIIVLLPIIDANMPALQPYIPAHAYQYLGLAIVVARMIKQKKDSNVDKTGI